MTNHSIFLDELLQLFYHKFIYYVPREIIIDGILDDLKGQIDEDFFDMFTFLDNTLGSGYFDNENALEINTLLLEKKSLLQQNIFKLVEKSKELNEVEFLMIIEKYYEHLSLFIFITEWLSVHLKEYFKEEIHLSIIGAFKIQMHFFGSHLKDLCNYFGAFIDFEKEFNFSQEQFITYYLPELISRYSSIENNQIASKEEQRIVVATENTITDLQMDKVVQSNHKPIKKERKQPQIDVLEIEIMILEKVFKVNKK